MKKIAITTWCTDDYAEILNVERLTASIKYFHPDIDHIVIDSERTSQICQDEPWLDYVWMMAPTCIPYTDDYDMIIHVDADSIVVGPLTELIDASEDVIGVCNNNSLGQAGANGGITISHLSPWGNNTQIPMHKFLNAGLVGVNRMEFFFDWHSLNRECAKSKPQFLGDENDTLNQLFFWNKYSSRIIDRAGSGVSYGLSNVWGYSVNNHWQSWQELYVEDNRIMINDPVTKDPVCVKVLHQAGGSIARDINQKNGFYNWFYSLVTNEVKEFVMDITK